MCTFNHRLFRADIRNALIDRKITQKELSEAIHISVSYLNHYLNKKKILGDKQIDKIIIYLNLNGDDYIGNKSVPKERYTIREKDERLNISSAVYGQEIELLHELEDRTGLSIYALIRKGLNSILIENDMSLLHLSK